MQKAEHLSAALTQVGTGITVWSAVWGWLGDNHAAIASCGVIFGMFISVISYRRQVVNDRKIKRFYPNPRK